MKNRTPFILLLLFFNSIALGQTNCDCPFLTQQQLGELMSSNDSAAIYKTVYALRESGNKNCSIKADDLEIRYFLTTKSLPAAENIIAKQEKSIATLPCKNELIISNYLNHASWCKAAQDYEGLSTYAFKALETAELRKDKTYEVAAITYIVYLFTRQDQEEKNWAYIKRAEKIIKSFDEDYTTPANYNWLAFEYERKYTLTERLSLLDTAMMYASTARSAALRNNNYTELARCFRVFESYAYNHGDLQQAIRYIDSAIMFLKKIKTPTNPASLYFAKAWDYMDLKNFKEAEKWQDTSLYYAEKIEGRTPATMALYNEAAKLYEAAGNLPKAISTLKMYDHIKDSIFKLQRSEKINELEQKYNKAKNERTIKELDQQKSIYLLLSLAGLLAAVTIAFFFRQYSLQQKKKILETEQRLNRARMNPHFFFNALTALQKFALKENNGEVMAGNLSRFSKIMRETLESTYKEYVTIEHEMEFLSEYLEVQKIRFPLAFSYEVTAADELDIDELLIPAMIIQPFIENSIEHGFAGIDHAGKIAVHFTKENKSLLIQIADNGKGLAEAKENDRHISRASQIIKDRIYLLNIKLKTKAGFSIDNNMNGNGVFVKIHLPLLYKEQVKLLHHENTAGR